MNKEQIKSAIDTNPKLLLDIFYSITITKSGVELQGEFGNAKMLDNEVLQCLVFNIENGSYVMGSFLLDELYVNIVLT